MSGPAPYGQQQQPAPYGSYGAAGGAVDAGGNSRWNFTSGWQTMTNAIPGMGSKNESMAPSALPNTALPNSAEPPQSQHSIMRSGPLKAGQRPGVGVNRLELTCVPWVFLILILSMYLLAGAVEHNIFFIIWILPALLLTMCGAYTKNRHDKGRNGEVILGILCATAVIAGVVVGAYVHLTTLREFWRLGQGASYFNVIPNELAASKSDASSLSFIDAARVDTSRTYGLVDGNSPTGTLYCIAPVLAGDLQVDTRVQYWAAGKDCCFPRSDFNCGQAANETAHGALVLTPQERKDPMWEGAILGAQKAYGLQAGTDFLLVKWVEDPVAFRQKLYKKAITLFFVFGFVYLVISAIVAAAVMPTLKL